MHSLPNHDNVLKCSRQSSIMDCTTVDNSSTYDNPLHLSFVTRSQLEDHFSKLFEAKWRHQDHDCETAPSITFNCCLTVAVVASTHTTQHAEHTRVHIHSPSMVVIFVKVCLGFRDTSAYASEPKFRSPRSKLTAISVFRLEAVFVTISKGFPRATKATCAWSGAPPRKLFEVYVTVTVER